MEPAQFYSYTYDQVFEKCFTPNESIPETESTLFDHAICSLVEDRLVTRSLNADGDELLTPTGVPMEDVNDYTDMSPTSIASIQLKKTILGTLMLEKSKFHSIILYCQFDKSNQQGIFIVNGIKRALETKEDLPVIFVIGDNLSSLMDQTIDGFHKLLCRELGIDSDKYGGLMCLKGDEKVRQQDIENYIDSYHLDHLMDRPTKKLPPIIMALNNRIQLAKLIQIHQKKIVEPLIQGQQSPLRSKFVFDEFDKIYRSCRAMFKPILVDSPLGVSSVLGVTGSEDGIGDEFQEWTDSNLVRVEIDADKDRNYRGIHHPEAKIHRYKQKKGLSNNDYILQIMKETPSQFKDSRVNPRNGKSYFPKTLLLSDHRIASQKKLALQLLEMGFHVIQQNENNLKVCRSESNARWIPWSIRKKVVRNELYNIFNVFNLWDKPVVLIGNKKLDRGLGYHHAPPGRPESLIWTGEIMGRIEGNANRTQKVSRLHGVIAHCEDYPNELHFWIDEDTELTVCNENKIIKALHVGYQGYQTLGERMKYARTVTTLLKKAPKYLISENFATRALAKEWFLQAKISLKLPSDYECSSYGLYPEEAIEGSTHVEEGTPGISKIRYRGAFMSIRTDHALRQSDDMGQGANSSARIMPVFVDETIQFVVIYTSKPAEASETI